MYSSPCRTVPLDDIARQDIRLQGLIAQGPLVATDEMSFYANMIRDQGHRVDAPIVLDCVEDPDQAL